MISENPNKNETNKAELNMKPNATLNKNFEEQIQKHDGAKQTTDGVKTLQLNSIIDTETLNQECIYNSYIFKRSFVRHKCCIKTMSARGPSGAS